MNMFSIKNGKGGLVVMEMDNVTRCAKMAELRETLANVEVERLAGARYYSVDETVQMMQQAAIAKTTFGKSPVARANENDGI